LVESLDIGPEVSRGSKSAIAVSERTALNLLLVVAYTVTEKLRVRDCLEVPLRKTLGVGRVEALWRVICRVVF